MDGEVPHYLGDCTGCQSALSDVGSYYIYVLRRPDGWAFYVGKGVENGASCRIARSGMATVIPAQDPANEVFLLNESQARTNLGYIGLPKAINLGIAP
jgi:hypothetical protein